MRTYVGQRGRAARAADGADWEPGREGDAADTEDAIVSWGNALTRARLLRASPSVVLLEGQLPLDEALITPGTAVQLRLPHSARSMPGRLAAIGDRSRYLVALGNRPVRGAARVKVDLPALVRDVDGSGTGLSARVVDLSSTGARIRGISLPVGSECDLRFVPPGRLEKATLRCLVIRGIEEGEQTELGLAFCGGTLSFRVDLLSQAR